MLHHVNRAASIFKIKIRMLNNTVKSHVGCSALFHILFHYTTAYIITVMLSWHKIKNFEVISNLSMMYDIR